jgi:uracil-DNA glycosylase
VTVLSSTEISADWCDLVQRFECSTSGLRLAEFLTARQQAGACIYPLPKDRLRALMVTPLRQVRVLILGQDPYHGIDKKTGQIQAEGLAFSVADGAKPPPSLRNVFKELQRDLGRQPPMSGSLVRWARQGVLLLNTCLTVEADQPGSHAKQGWEDLTNAVIESVSSKREPCVFMLWGAHAQSKFGLIDSARHLVLQANHPSPLSALRPPAPFAGCGHFGACNVFLQENHRGCVDW